jgi:Omp85 superfamily domain
MIKIFSLVILLFSANCVFGQDSIAVDYKKLKLIGLPIVYYTPETRWVVGATSIVTFKEKEKETVNRPSNIQFGFAYSQLKQVLIYLPYQLWLKKNTINVQGELGYYIYNYYFYGTGNNFQKNYSELYDITFPRIRIAVLKEITKNKFLGFRFGYDDFTISNLVQNGALASDTINGSRGGDVAPFGAMFKIETRDNIFNASEGIFLEAYYEMAQKKILGGYSYNKFSIDVSCYKKINKISSLAINGFAQHSSGDVPFFQLPGLGGNKKMRGYYEFFYRDKNAWVLQAEWRQNIYKIIGCTIFGSIGEVQPKWEYAFKDIRSAYGAGLRVMLDKKQKINLRLDAGVGEKKVNYYFTILEAF